MKKIAAILTIVLCLFTCVKFASAGSAVLSEVRTSQPYHSITMQGDAELVLVPSSEFEITLEGTNDQLMNMVTLLKDGTLHIIQTNNKDRKNQRTRIFVGVKELTSLYVKGHTEVSANGLIDTERLKIRTEDGAAVNLDVRAHQPKSKTLGYLDNSLH